MAKNKTRKPRSKAAIYKKQAMHEKLIQANHAYIYKKGENIGYTEATIIMLWLLHTEYGFGKARLARFLRQIMSFCEAYIVPTPDNREEGEFTGLGLEDMATALALPFHGCLHKIKNSKTQHELKGKERRNAQKGSYACDSLHGEKVLLVDDICTTGETMKECARMLKEAGASQVIGLAIAKTLTYDPEKTLNLSGK